MDARNARAALAKPSSRHGARTNPVLPNRRVKDSESIKLSSALDGSFGSGTISSGPSPSPSFSPNLSPRGNRELLVTVGELTDRIIALEAAVERLQAEANGVCMPPRVEPVALGSPVTFSTPVSSPSVQSPLVNQGMGVVSNGNIAPSPLLVNPMVNIGPSPVLSFPPAAL